MTGWGGAACNSRIGFAVTALRTATGFAGASMAMAMALGFGCSGAGVGSGGGGVAAAAYGISSTTRPGSRPLPPEGGGSVSRHANTAA
ncbi:MAG: hypothetical protein H7Y60_05810 [Rhodospirillaceae bacterium]|nr:hypothetical protein [Rhodospirillales bacterium]